VKAAVIATTNSRTLVATIIAAVHQLLPTNNIVNTAIKSDYWLRWPAELIVNDRSKAVCLYVSVNSYGGTNHNRYTSLLETGVYQPKRSREAPDLGKGKWLDTGEPPPGFTTCTRSNLACTDHRMNFITNQKLGHSQGI